MYLKRLELQGFKSFADRTILQFKPGITSVIGPNGSGKSNISDSIRWVLGEQSMKSLRGAKSEDIIFAGTENRKSLGFAESSIIIDNSDGILPVEYNEVVVTRRIYRSGETGYFINKVPCRLKDILELFMDTGIGKDGYSIIGQGKIDEILSNKSEDRRHIFEEAAGIVKYRTRKIESEKKLEQTKLNLLRINDILTEIENQIEPLKFQAEKAKKFLELREELKKIEVGLFIYNINTYKEKIKKIVEDLETLIYQKDDENKELLNLQDNKEKIKLKIEELVLEIERVQNLDFESKNRIEKIYSKINIYKEKELNNNINIERFQKEINELEVKIKDLKNEEKNKTEKKANLSINKEKFKLELKQKEKELEEITKKLSNKELEIENKKKKIEENTDNKYERINELNIYNVNFENLKKREKLLKQDLQLLISELDENRINKQEISKIFLEIDNSRNKLLKKLNQIKEEKEKKINIIKSYHNKINALTEEFRIKDSKLKFLEETEREKDGYNKSIKSILLACEKDKLLNDGVEGVLADLISVDKKYETAIEISLGQAIQNIVTQGENEAKKLINYLKSNNLGRASFLPISTVKGKKLDKLVKNDIQGVIGIAADLIKYNKKYENIILSLLGRTIIVENIDSAIKLAKLNKYLFKIVTLSGDVINSSGAITGGSINHKTVNILGRSREIEEIKKEILKIKNKIEEITNKKEEYSLQITKITETIEKLNKSLQEIEINYIKEQQKINNIDISILKMEKDLEKIKKEIEEISKKEEEIQIDKQGINKVIENLEQEILKLNIEISEYKQLNKNEIVYIDNLNIDITNLKISVNSFDESSSSIEEIVERIKIEIKDSEKNMEDKKFNIKKLNQDNKQIKLNIEDLDKQILEIKREVENSSSTISKLKQEKEINTNKQESFEKQIEEKFINLNELKEQIIKIENKKGKNEQEVEILINKLWEEYQITPNNSKEYEKPNNIQLAQKTTNEIKYQIKELGSINVDAIEEAKKMQERYDFMNEQRYDLEQTIRKLRNIIIDMTTTMKNQFIEKFKEINKNFNEVFVELFGGGKAELILENSSNILECGIDIKVQPLGKKLQNMMLLSGGEKALTAIAILFAILKTNPAPFCILDEIEAALDDVNVNRFAVFLKKFSKDTQFLVITHRKGTMEVADTVYGVTMEEKGISKLLSMQLNKN